MRSITRNPDARPRTGFGRFSGYGRPAERDRDTETTSDVHQAGRMHRLHIE